MMPFHILAIWVRGLLSILLLILGPILLYQWYQRAHVQMVREDEVSIPATTQASLQLDDTNGNGPRYTRVFDPDWGLNGETALFLAGMAATLWAVPKGPFVLRRLLRRPGPDEPRFHRTGEVRMVARPDGSELRVEMYGPPDGQPVVLTHGWGLDSEEWYYAKKNPGRFRLIVWDLPGLGLSKQPANHDYSLENLARELEAVIDVAGGRPVVLLGHSIGGMICLTHAKLFPEALGTRVCGMVLVNTTYTNPLRTTRMAGLASALQKPVIEPLLHMTIWLSPLVRVMNWMSYLNGSAHRSAEKSGFSGRETRGQLDFVARYTPRTSPAVLARGMLGMLRYDATDTLRGIAVPVLVVTGDRDSVCKPQASERMRADIPEATLLTLSPAKHEGLIEHHGQFNEAISAFIDRCAIPDRNSGAAVRKHVAAALKVATMRVPQPLPEAP
jgi:pimeloyl-ACP methyl ester carboxylesterase